MFESTETQERDLLAELDRLDERVQEITRLVEALRDEKQVLARECERLRAERSATVGRLTHLIEKVDLLRGES